MVHHHRASLLLHHKSNQQQSKGGDALLLMLAAFAFVSCLLLLLPSGPFSAAMDDLLQLGSTRCDQESMVPCSAVPDGTICCDRTAPRTDVCVMRGDIRTHAASNSLFLLLPASSSSAGRPDERIRPYTRKWESSVMSTIDELRLRAVPEAEPARCHVRHNVTAVVFSTGGYTGNVYHEFNDGIIPLYITAREYNKKVVFVMLEYHDWWMTKYGHILEQLSDYAPIDFANDTRTHCFPEAVVGLRIHDELAIDASRMPGNQGIQDFRQMLDAAYRGRIKVIIGEEEEKAAAEAPAAEAKKGHPRSSGGGMKVRRSTEPLGNDKPRLVIVSRNGSRAIENEAELVRVAERVGFRVDLLQPRPDTELAHMYRVLNESDVMVGVHGAAMTHFLFMRSASVFIQVVPLGTDWAADNYYGEPARRLGLRYIPYKILPSESSLHRHYSRDDPVLTDPVRVNAKGWQVTKKVYLDGQNVRLDMARFRRRLREAYGHWATQRRREQSKPL